MCIFYVRQNENRPAIETTLFFDGAEFPLLPTDTVLFQLLDSVTYAVVFSGPCVQTGVSPGRVQFRWPAPSTAIKGVFAAQFVVTRGANSTLVPPDNYHIVHVF